MRKKKNIVSEAHMQAPKHATDSPPMTPVGERRKSGNFKNMAGFLIPGAKAKEQRKSIFVRSRNPMAKLFDGATSLDDDEPPLYEPSHLDLEGNDTERVHSPVPFRPFSPDDLAGRRRGLYTSDNEALVPVSLEEDAFRPVWLESLISTPKTAAAKQTVAGGVDVEKDGVDAGMRLKMSMEGWDERKGRNPWVAREGKGRVRDVSEIAPDVVG
jgi:hypothetical protein